MRRPLLTASSAALALLASGAVLAAPNPAQAQSGSPRVAAPAARSAAQPSSSAASPAARPGQASSTQRSPASTGASPVGTSSGTTANTSLPTAPLANDPPAVADCEAVQLRTQDDLRLAASFFPPRGRREARSPAAILVHDAGRSRSDLVDLASALQKRGFAVLTLDLRGHGESRTAEVAFRPEDPTAAERLWAFTLRDVEAAAAFLRSRSDVHTSNLSLVGVGAGAALAARHALRDGNARAVVLVAPREENLGFNLMADVRGLGGLPTLILAERDRKSDADRLAQAGNQAEGLAFIEVAVLRSSGAEAISDSRVPREVARHLQDNAAAKR